MKNLIISIMMFVGFGVSASALAQASTSATGAALATPAGLDSKVVSYGNPTAGYFEGYMAWPKNLDKKTPAILIVHNWMGVTDETKKQAHRFAELGYIAFAADVYGKGQNPKNSNEASQMAGRLKGDRKYFRERLNLALDTLKKEKLVDTKKLAAAGYCFGGTGVIELGRSGADVKALISFHGGLDSPTPKDGKKIKGELLVHHGEIDPFVPAKDLEAFISEMTTNKVKYELIKYPGAVHSFTDVGAGDDIKKGAAYNAEADQKSFAASKEFLHRIFK